MSNALNRTRSSSYTLHRREVVTKLLADRGDLLVVAGLGACNWDITAVGDTALNFPLWVSRWPRRIAAAQARPRQPRPSGSPVPLT